MDAPRIEHLICATQEGLDRSYEISLTGDEWMGILASILVAVSLDPAAESVSTELLTLWRKITAQMFRVGLVSSEARTLLDRYKVLKASENVKK